MVMRSGRGVEPHGGRVTSRRFPDNRAAPARDEQAHQDSNPDQRGWSSPCFRYTTGLRERTTRIERASPGWRPGALPSELRPRETPGWTRTSDLCRRRAALDPLSHGRKKEPPAGVEPAPRPYKGRVLAVDTTEASQIKWSRRDSNPRPSRALVAGFTAEQPTTRSPPRVHSRRTRAAAPQWRRRESNPRPPRCKRGAPPGASSPSESADGWSRTTTARGDAGYSRAELTGAQRPHEKRVTGRIRTGAAGFTTPGAAVYTTATTKRGRPDSNRQPLA